jgi:hypothetical protein
MAERAGRVYDSSTTTGGHSWQEHENGPEPLEQRVRRLEDAVAALQDTRLLEERIVERLAGRAPAPAPAPAPEPTPDAPAAPVEEHTQVAAPPAPPVLVPPLTLNVPMTGTSRPSWLFFDVVRELRLMFRMFWDTRFRVAWTTRLLVLLTFLYILTSHLWSPVYFLPLIGGFADKLVDLVVALLLYKVLGREVRRYEEALTANQPWARARGEGE